LKYTKNARKEKIATPLFKKEKTNSIPNPTQLKPKLNQPIKANQRKTIQTNLQKAAEYAALTQYVEFPGTSFKMALVRIALASTRCGQFPLCIHTDT